MDQVSKARTKRYRRLVPGTSDILGGSDRFGGEDSTTDQDFRGYFGSFWTDTAKEKRLCSLEMLGRLKTFDLAQVVDSMISVSFRVSQLHWLSSTV